MTESKRGPTSGLGGVLGQIILCKQMVPDFNQEELCSIRTDAEYIQQLIDDMQEFMPMEESHGKSIFRFRFFAVAIRVDQVATAGGCPS